MDPNVVKGAIKKSKSKKPYKRNFQNSWLDENIFKGWLASHSELNKACCTVCNVSIRCCRTDLVKHSQTVKHIDEIRTRNQSFNNKPNRSHKDNVK